MTEAFTFDFDGVLVGIDMHTDARIEAFEEFYQTTGDKRFLVTRDIHDRGHLHGSNPPEIIGWVLQQQGLVAKDAKPAEDQLTLAGVARKMKFITPWLQMAWIPCLAH